MSLGSRAKRYWKTKGPVATAGQTVRYAWRKISVRDSPTFARRKILGADLYRRFGGEVQYGPLKGSRLSNDATWGALDMGAMLLGLYEQPVQEHIARLAKGKSLFVDIGSADGYFGVGVVASGLFDRSICFEIDPITRAGMMDVVALNGVGNKVTSFGAADSTLPSKLRSSGFLPEQAVILCDIEGAEFDLFNAELLDMLRGADIVMELHDWLVRDGDQKLAALIEAAKRHFSVGYIEQGPRDPTALPVLQDMPDDDRWLLCSESRPRAMRWLVLTPKA